MNYRAVLAAGALFLVGGLLTACSDSDEQAASGKAEAAKTTQEDAGALQEERIVEYLTDYELPQEGRLPKDHELYSYWDEGAVILYENGYSFDGETKELFAIAKDSGDMIEGQEPAFANMKLEEATNSLDMAMRHNPEGLPEVIATLGQVKDVNEFPPLEGWLQNRIDGLMEVEAIENAEKRKAMIEPVLLSMENLLERVRETANPTKPYEPEIAQFFADYELPEAGQIPKDDPTYKGVNVDALVAYENGMMFERSSGQMVARKHYDDGTKSEPTPEQATGAVMGLIADAASNGGAQRHASQGSEFMIGRLSEAKELNEFPPLEEWLTARIEGYTAADAMNDDQDRVLALTNENAELNKMVQLFRK
ncbi:hypothetical protein [Bhargavaea cecembensis]|nr:hypothetical protein [Bhargavaea cecembensis]